MSFPGEFMRTLGLLRKHWLRHRYRNALHTSLDLSRLERTMHAQLYADAGRRLGLTVSSLGPVLCLRNNGKSFLIEGVWTDFDTVPLCQLCGDKVVVEEILRSRGLRVPRGQAFAACRMAPAEEYAHSLPGPWVVKPARGTSSGIGVTVDVSDRRAFRKAFLLAALFSDEVLVQEFVHGNHLRFLVYKGRCISVVRRETPSVTGDGRCSVRALIRRENRARITSSDWRPGDPALLPLPANRIARAALADEGMSLTTVPASGQKVRVAGLCHSYALGASYLEVFAQIHPAQMEAAETAARVLGVTLAGVDIITPDHTREEHAINEVNTTPSLEIHYLVGNREQMRDPIAIILRDYFGLGAPAGEESPAWPAFFRGERE